MYVSPAQGLSDHSCPYLYAGLQGKADLSLLKPLQRDHGWAEEVWGAGLADTAAASLGFGSWEAGTGVKVGRWRGGMGLGVLQDVKGVAGVYVCVAGGQRQEAWEWG